MLLLCEPRRFGAAEYVAICWSHVNICVFEYVYITNCIMMMITSSSSSSSSSSNSSSSSSSSNTSSSSSSSSRNIYTI